MPEYTYEAVDKSGKKVRAGMQAPDEAAIRAEIEAKGLMPISIRESSGFNILPKFGQRIKTRDLLGFTRELGNLIESGLPIDRSLYVLSVHSEKESMRSLLKQIYIDIQRGLSLSQALSKHPVFPKLYVNMVRAGEAGGTLETSIKRLTAYLETTETFKEEVVSALIYPLLLTTVGGLGVSVLLFYVIPKFASMFKEMGQALPLPTQILMAISGFLTSYWWIILAAVALTAAVIRSYAKTTEGRVFMDGLKLKTPVISGLHTRILIARYARTLGTLLQSGVPMLESLIIARDVVGNDVVSERLAALEDGVRKGHGVSAPLRESGVFPPIVAQVIAVGEEAGRLEQAFMTVAERFEAESRSTIKRAVGLIEPLMILIMGLLVAAIVISMIWAVFSINEIPL